MYIGYIQALKKKENLVSEFDFFYLWVEFLYCGYFVEHLCYLLDAHGRAFLMNYVRM